MAKLSVWVRSDEEGQKYELNIDEAGAPSVGEVLGIEVKAGDWRDFKVVSRRYNFGVAGTIVIVEAEETGDTPPSFEWL
jgi:hypothetical protein